MSLLNVHRLPHPSMIVQRFHFHTEIQKPSESVIEFAQLRNIYEFGDTLQDMLSDRLV